VGAIRALGIVEGEGGLFAGRLKDQHELTSGWQSVRSM